jgi:hypothetical protein
MEGTGSFYGFCRSSQSGTCTHLTLLLLSVVLSRTHVQCTCSNTNTTTTTHALIYTGKAANREDTVELPYLPRIVDVLPLSFCPEE